MHPIKHKYMYRHGLYVFTGKWLVYRTKLASDREIYTSTDVAELDGRSAESVNINANPNPIVVNQTLRRISLLGNGITDIRVPNT